MNNHANNSVHWADITADKIIRQRPNQASYTCASGITPSGTVHIGNFREIISVDLVVKALRDKGKQVRFIYSWDDYDVFRKVPANMPNKAMLETHLRKPIVFTPDPHGEEESYARYNEKQVEVVLPLVGVSPEFIYQADQYRASRYAAEMKTALEKKRLIIDILNQHRQTPLDDSWWPISVFCDNCQKDTTEIKSWDGEWQISYVCTSCAHQTTVDLRKASSVKLFWRVDWPMRWSREKVDFEPAGKEHHSAGGSFDTAKQIVGDVFGYPPPETFKYDFISVKGMGGKISSSLGNVISLRQVLDVYQPEIVRYLFAGTRPNAEFAISFDLDVIKIYEDYDRCERIYFGTEVAVEKKREKEARIYEFSQITAIPESQPFTIGFRHLCNLLQIQGGDIEAVLQSVGEQTDKVAQERLRVRARCAANWLENYAPQDFKFSLVQTDAELIELGATEREVLSKIKQTVATRLDIIEEEEAAQLIYDLAQAGGMEPKDLFALMYRVLIGSPKGPRLVGFLKTIGQKKVLELLGRYV